MELLFPLLIFGLLWALLILPQQRRMRAQQEMQRSLQPGDEVVTSSGIYGRVTELDTDSVLVEVAPGIELRIARAAIGRVLPAEEGATAVDQDDDVAAGDDADVVDADVVDADGQGDTSPVLPPEPPGGATAPRRDDA